MNHIGEGMPPEDSRTQVTITLSSKTFEELSLVAKEKGIPVATLIRHMIEREHESLEFGALVERAKAWRDEKNK